jgi:hypothetical protein
MIKWLINYLYGLIFGFSWTRDCYVIHSVMPEVRAYRWGDYEKENRGL